MNRVAQMRMVADYTGEEIPMEKAQWAVEQATLFLQVVRTELEPTD